MHLKGACKTYIEAICIYSIACLKLLKYASCAFFKCVL